VDGDFVAPEEFLIRQRYTCYHEVDEARAHHPYIKLQGRGLLDRPHATYAVMTCMREELDGAGRGQTLENHVGPKKRLSKIRMPLGILKRNLQS